MFNIRLRNLFNRITQDIKNKYTEQKQYYQYYNPIDIYFVIYKFTKSKKPYLFGNAIDEDIFTLYKDKLDLNKGYTINDKNKLNKLELKYFNAGCDTKIQSYNIYDEMRSDPNMDKPPNAIFPFDVEKVNNLNNYNISVTNIPVYIPVYEIENFVQMNSFVPQMPKKNSNK